MRWMSCGVWQWHKKPCDGAKSTPARFSFSNSVFLDTLPLSTLVRMRKHVYGLLFTYTNGNPSQKCLCVETNVPVVFDKVAGKPKKLRLVNPYVKLVPRVDWCSSRLAPIMHAHHLPRTARAGVWCRTRRAGAGGGDEQPHLTRLLGHVAPRGKLNSKER